MFLLQSDGRTDEGFTAYRDYVAANAARFPAGALQLAQSDWYYAPFDHRGPHDARLEAMSVSERPGPGDPHWHHRVVSIQVTLRGAYDDGFIVLNYPTVHDYRLDTTSVSTGHADWRYDELRLDDAGHLVHEVEWHLSSATARWLIVADDIEMVWRPDGGEPQAITSHTASRWPDHPE